jgi:broad specificity phosphatase PhoE
MPVTRLLLLRHGVTAANDAGELQGREIDLPLSDAGREQARRTAEFLAAIPFVAVYTSPLRRAEETARVVAEPHGLEVCLAEGLVECRVGRWAGLTWEAIRERFPHEFRAFRADPIRHPYPGGERYDEVRERLVGCFQTLFDWHEGATFACVGHSVVNRVFLSHLLGVPLDRTWNVPQVPGCVNVVTRTSGTMRVDTVSSSFHLSSPNS